MRSISIVLVTMVVFGISSAASSSNADVRTMTPDALASSRAAFDSKLPNYPSSRFRSVFLMHGFDKTDRKENLPGVEFTALCGEINTQNRNGGYTGWTAFVVERTEPAPIAVIEDMKAQYWAEFNRHWVAMRQYDPSGDLQEADRLKLHKILDDLVTNNVASMGLYIAGETVTVPLLAPIATGTPRVAADCEAYGSQVDTHDFSRDLAPHT